MHIEIVISIINQIIKFPQAGINNKLSFIKIFQFLSSLLDSLVKNLDKDAFKY